MKQCLADANPLLPVLVPRHKHHNAAMRWFDGLAANECVVCRQVQLSVIRLLGLSAVMGDAAISAAAAWDAFSELLKVKLFNSSQNQTVSMRHSETF